ncbi:MAG TPA: peptide ABC transporter substrate-binding protein [Candidatus Saccharimonadales bacterium]|nr:peptide ABC transporter substrate-binding protein [Candidatus Saccharimonadales bacterium]
MDKKRAFKLRFRRKLRLQKRQVEELSAQAEQRLENDFFKRLERLGNVRRFVATWVLLLVLLIGSVVAQTRSLNGYYQVMGPVLGGTYTEGVLGAFTNANPVYATDIVDTSVSRLLFSGLLTYNEQNELTGDLAEWWSVDQNGTLYTVRLKPDLRWHDGRPLTANDVAFTYQVIQNPDARSPLYNSWQGIAVQAVDERTITFTLPNVLASFPYSLTNGIVPKHILGGAPMADMRSVSFNSTRPIGSGPFQWQAIELSGGSADKREEHILLKANANYHMGKPKLANFVVRTFRSTESLTDSFKRQELNAAVGLTSVPDELKENKGMQVHNLPLTAAVMTFFKTTEGVLSDVKVRQALVQAVDTAAIIKNLDYATRPVRSPLLIGQTGYNPTHMQLLYNPAAAAALLDGAGWVMGKDGYRSRGGVPLTFRLSVHNSTEYVDIAKQLANMWRAIGAKAELEVAVDEATFQATLSNHSYQALLYGISIGVDPDVYVYWHSSQADVRAPVRLNFSEYKSPVADAALEGGRTRLDPALRVAKYQPFLQAWQGDAPALGLYQPRFLYLSRGIVHGLNERPINTDAGRFTNVHNWQIREAWQTPKR